jgi:hypothetical protein
MVLDQYSIAQNIVKGARNLANSYLGPNTSFVNLTDVLDNNEMDEQYVLPGIMFKVTHANHGQTDESNNNSYSKRQRKAYNRIFMFGDLQGNTFCVICETDAQSRSTTSSCTDLIAIGEPFLLIEPRLDGSTLRRDMPVMTVTNPLIPLCVDVVNSFNEMLPAPQSRQTRPLSSY